MVCKKCGDTGEYKIHLTNGFGRPIDGYQTYPCDCVAGLKLQHPGAVIHKGRMISDNMFSADDSKFNACYVTGYPKTEGTLIFVPKEEK